MPGLLSYFWGRETEKPGEDKFVLVTTSPPPTQFYNVRGWEVVDECEVLAETSQAEALSKHGAKSQLTIASAPATTATDTNDDVTSSVNAINSKPVGNLTVAITKSSANCRPSQSASAALDRLAPTKMRSKKKATKAATSAPAPPAKKGKGRSDLSITTDSDCLTHTSTPNAKKTTVPAFSYAAMAAAAVTATAVHQSAAATQKAEAEEAKKEALLLRVQNEMLTQQNTEMAKQRTASLKLKMKKTKAVPLARLFQTTAPSPAPAPKVASAGRSWAQMAKA